MESANNTDEESTQLSTEQAQGSVSKLPVPTGGKGDRTDKPNSEGLGELLSNRSLQSVLWIRERLGREEGMATLDACAEAQGFRLEQME